MFGALTALHIVVAISLVLIVLLQTGRGAELGAAFGGMGQATYGRGQSTFISKLTTVLAIVFMITSLSLAFLTSERPQQSLLQTESGTPSAPAPAQPGNTGQGQTGTPQAPATPSN